MPHIAYISELGSATGDGTRNNPWPTVEFALGKMGGGNTVVIMDGACQPFVVQWKYAGTEENPTVVKAENSGQATVRNATTHGIYIASKADHVVLEGVSVEGSRSDGIKIAGNGCRVHNCTSTKNVRMGISAHGVSDLVLDGNSVFENGTSELYDHGIYVSGTGVVIRRNTVSGNAAYGIHCYPELRASTIAYNYIHSDRRGALLVYGVRRLTGNAVFGNTLEGMATLVQCKGTYGDTIAWNKLQDASSLLLTDCRDCLVADNINVPA